MGNHVVSRVGQILRARNVELRSWPEVSREVAEANDHRKDRAIDHRTLKKLADPEKDEGQLRINQFIALDTYMIALGEDAFLTKDRTVVDSIAESLDVNFLVAARQYEGLDDYAVSRWDLGATTRLMRTRLNQLRVRIWDIADATLWEKKDSRLADCPNVAVGSPIANPGTEQILCQMLGIEPNVKCPVDSLPFLIVRADRDKKNRSAFVRTRRETARFDAKRKVELAPGKRAFVVDGKMYKSTDVEDYALLVAQRTAGSGHVQAVICGLSGRATHHLAYVLQSGQPQDTVPDPRASEQNPPVFVALYRMHLSDADGKTKVVGESLVGKPTLLRRSEGEWQFDDRFDAAC